jgi:hypothetical protein
MNIRRADPAAHQRQAAPKRGGRNSGLAAFDVRERDRVVAGEHRADLVVGNPAVFDLGAECGEELAQGAQRALAEHPELDGKILRAEQLQGVEKHRQSLVGEDAPEEEKAERACFRGGRRPDSRACLESQVRMEQRHQPVARDGARGGELLGDRMAQRDHGIGAQDIQQAPAVEQARRVARVPARIVNDGEIAKAVARIRGATSGVQTCGINVTTPAERRCVNSPRTLR